MCTRNSGYEDDEIGNTLDEWAMRIHPDDKAECLADLDRHFRGETEFYANEHRVRCKDGSYKWILDRGKVIERTGDGQPLRAIGTHQDITQQRDAEEKLRHAQKMEAVGQLTGGVAHEFNNILQAIEGFLSLAHNEIKDNERLASFVHHALTAGRRGAGLTHQLLAFSRNQTLQPRICDTNSTLEEILELLAPTLGDDIGIEIRLSPDVGSIFIDRNELMTALLNIALNARWAMPNGGRLTVASARRRVMGELFVDGGVLAAGDYVEIALTDTGFGMDKNVLARAFEPFFTTKDVGAGSGLGLSMVYGFARQSGGNATLESEVGVGTTVRLVLPAIKDQAAPIPGRIGGPALETLRR